MQVTKKAIQNRKNLPESIQKLILTIEKESNMSISTLKNLVQTAQIQEAELMPWADFEHSPAQSYGRKMLYDGGFFEIMVMSWMPQDFSAIHDHGQAQWGAVQIFGGAEHAVFLLQDGELKTLSRQKVKAGQIIGVGCQLIHQMGNPTENERF